jgi:hypothetical protein
MLVIIVSSDISKKAKIYTREIWRLIRFGVLACPNRGVVQAALGWKLALKSHPCSAGLSGVEPNFRAGDFAILVASAFVVRHVAPSLVVAGNPARILSRRERSIDEATA